MATKYFFDNKMVVLPGAYATIVSGEQSQPLSLDYGKVLVIDTGVEGANYGGGAGINGQLSSGKNAIYKFNNLNDYQAFLKGGLFWKMAEALFKPDKRNGALGVSEVYHARAATTTSAQMTFTAIGGGTGGGDLIVNIIDEGTWSNGVIISGNNLSKGYGFEIRTGEQDPNKWIIDYYVSSYTGVHTDNIPYNELDQDQSPKTLLISSPEFDNMQTLIDWANTDSGFGRYFVLDPLSNVNGDGHIDNDDTIIYLDALTEAAGGSETYSLTDLEDLLEAVADADFSFIITDQYGKTDYKSAENLAVVDYIMNESKFKHFMYIGGGKDENEFTSADGSCDMAIYYNNSYVNIVHGDVGTASDMVAEGIRWWPSLYHVALMVGRAAGKPPQVPLTNKSLGVDKLKHNLTLKEQERALGAGVKVTIYNQYLLSFVCLQDVNTLQDNTRLFTPNGKSFQGSFMRIIEQINKELIVNAEVSLLSDENGVNANTLSKGDVVNFTETYLESRLAKPDLDNLILDYRDVTATKDQDAWKVTYGIVVNNEINKIFFTGYLFS